MSNRTELANAIRALSMDAVQKAESGHPGAPMGMADIAEVLWNDFLVHNPGNPGWFNRDRFVLSNGHASMLLYSLLHLSGYALPMQELEAFRQLHSHTPGHPEYGETVGVETTTGPLGQGLGNAVGMALAEKMLAAHYNRDGHALIDHHTYVFVGDGCLMEGISHEVCSLAGTLKLGKLIAIYDDNGISIDGHVEGWFTDDTAKRFEAYGWQVVRAVDGHDPQAVAAAIAAARAADSRPSLICCRTVIGKGAPKKQGTEAVHGAALGAGEISAARAALGWEHAPFHIPADIYAGWDARTRGAAAEAAWQQRLEDYRVAFPDAAAELERRMRGELPEEFAAAAARYVQDTQDKGENIASRKASQNALQALAPLLPELVGGSADLAGSNLTLWKGAQGVSAQDAGGNYLHYGVREFGMGAIMNGLALHGGLRPFGGTFLVFMEYMRNAVRLAALMGAPVIYVYTHDSIGLGEDGPTHQPIEQLANLRGTPRLAVWRPGDAVESAVAWQQALLNQSGPSALVFSRQNLAHQPRTPEQLAAIARGGYVLENCDGVPEAILIATGSELALARTAAQQFNADGRRVRVVSMPSCDRFDAQEPAWREAVLPSSVRARVAIEAAHADYWYKYVGLDGRVIGMRDFGASAPADELMKLYGFSIEHVVAVVQEMLDS
ncbi:MAG: transketolase [Gammaproteobacteria bacterium]|jgi:transketolase|nr:transketolase [Gammaproteobacteria bacterium]MBK7518929.1 transketolase [Gammaproteobacteria bacterium]MBK7730329.1 transketolase [Gammaproteobacteria bacterium]MBK9665817.1 transketolase [Gammaproteobacteria bacterium]MBP6227592.1 transketolase [Pseudomonadales bacterium]